jgi:glutathione S-transferase
MKLVIGDKLWSTWSMRPWLVAVRAGMPFEEVRVKLRREDTADQISVYSPSGKVPVLIDGDLVIPDSLAICERLADVTPDLWPADPTARALARAAVSEMHSGFQSLRGECPMDLSLRTSLELSEATQKDVRRIVQLWLSLRRQFGEGGPFLLGAWSIADAFYTPVATRFVTYAVDLADYGDDGTAAAYVKTLLATDEYLAWEREALDN